MPLVSSVLSSTAVRRACYFRSTFPDIGLEISPPGQSCVSVRMRMPLLLRSLLIFNQQFLTVSMEEAFGGRYVSNIRGNSSCLHVCDEIG